MNTLTTSTPSLSTAVTPVSPRPMGRASGYSEETVGRLCEMIRRRGMSDGAAGLSLGISRPTLSRWKKEHAELAEWLAMAREQFRDAKLAIVDNAKTADGRPDWRAAAWALEKAFPEDYGRSAGRAPQGRVVDLAAEQEPLPPMWQPDFEAIGRRIEQQEALRASRGGEAA